MVTTTLAILTGFILITWVKPGEGLELKLAGNADNIEITSTKISDILLNIIPKNIFEVLAQGQLLPIIFFAFIFGYYMTRIKPGQQDFLRNFFESVLEVIMKITVFRH
ncbi:MAG: dicarboxylate/amino acid:cation symporter [Bacteroidales bacterium]|nr:dicarboxylate/amino acid:cation symporter [Bacteroidales bacterium]